MSRKRSKPAQPGGSVYGGGNAQLARARADLITQSMGDAKVIQFVMRALIAAVEATGGPLRPSESPWLRAWLCWLLEQRGGGDFVLDTRYAVGVWLRDYLEKLAPLEAPPARKRGRGNRVNPKVDKAATEARFDIEHFDRLRALGIGNVPSDQVVLDKTVARVWPNAVKDGIAIYKRASLKKAVQRRR